MSQHGKVHWNELMTRDVEKAKAFYAATLGWTFDAMPMPGGTYWICKAGDQPAGGLFDMKDPKYQGLPEQWFTYFAVDDVDACLAKARTSGAKIEREPFEVPGVGRIAILSAPGGAMMGWMTSAQS